MNSLLGLLKEVAEEATEVVAEATETTSAAVADIASENLANNSVTWNDVLKVVVDWCTSTGIRLLISILIMIISFKIIDFTFKRIGKKLKKKNADATLSKVLVNFGRIALKILILICLIGYVGIETASLSALVLAIGTGISLALQGTLSNFAGGVIIIIMRPFVLGDFITSNGESGTVEDIKLFYTYIVTPDNKMVMIPNGALANNVIVNFSAKDTRRVDVVMSIAYSADAEKAKEIAKGICAANELVLKNPYPFAEVGEYSASSVDIFVRCWCKKEDYWTVKFFMLKEIKKAYDNAGIEIPFDQLDVNIKQG